MRRLIEKGLLFGGLVLVDSPVLVERYRRVDAETSPPLVEDAEALCCLRARATRLIGTVQPSGHCRVRLHVVNLRHLGRSRNRKTT